VQHIGSEVWYEKAKAWAEVVGRPDQGAEFIELDVLAIMGQNAYRTSQCEPNYSGGLDSLTMICHSIQRRARASAITLLRGNIWRPDPTCTWFAVWSDMPNLMIGENQVQKCQSKVPGEDEQILKDSVDWCQKEHDWGRKKSHAVIYIYVPGVLDTRPYTNYCPIQFMRKRVTRPHKQRSITIGSIQLVKLKESTTTKLCKAIIQVLSLE